MKSQFLSEKSSVFVIGNLPIATYAFPMRM